MKRLLKAIVCLCVFIPLLIQAVPAAANTKIPILMYHHFAEKGPYTTLTMSPGRFSEHMSWLRNHGFTAILPSELPLIASGELPMPQRPVVVTFDDGYKSNYELAYPVLKKTGIKVGIAIVTSMMGGQSWGMSWEQMQEMHDSGLVEFGSHTQELHYSSGPYKGQGVRRRSGETKEQYLDRVVPDLEASAAMIENRLGQPCVWLCYPFGANDAWLDEYLATSPRFPVTTIIGGRIADIGRGMRNLNRVRVGEKEPVWQDRAILEVYNKKSQAVGIGATVSIGERTELLSAYSVEGTNYVRLRDLAMLMTGTEHAFNVGWDNSTRRVSVSMNQDYAPIGGELAGAPGDRLNAVPHNEPVLFDGQEKLITFYNFHGTNYVNLRWVSRLLGFSVGWDDGSRTVIIK